MEKFSWEMGHGERALYLANDDTEYTVCIYSAVNNTIWSYPLSDWFGGSAGWIEFQHQLTEEDVAEAYCVER